MIKEEETLDEVLEAKRQGHKFIKLFLHRSRIGRNQAEIIISGAVALRGIKKGSGIGGLPDYDFHPVVGESLVFTFSREEREYVCWMYDDQEPGYFSPIGYNRDLLATHLDDNFFVVNDVAVLQDIQSRYEWLKSNPDKRNKRQVAAAFTTGAPQSVDEIDAQIEMLKERKRLAMESGGQVSQITDTIQRTEVDRENTAAVVDAKEQARIARNKKQREYRARKKAETAEKKELEPSNA